MNNTINLADAYKLASEIDTETELVVTDPVTHKEIATLSGFAQNFRTTASAMNHLCVQAAILANFNRPVFMEYVTTKLGLSRSTAIQMINAGELYQQDHALLAAGIGYSKVVELAPVKEQLNDFYGWIDGDGGAVAELSKRSQKTIRDNVKYFLSLGTKQLEQPEPEQELEQEQEPEQELEQNNDFYYIDTDSISIIYDELSTIIGCVAEARAKAATTKDRVEMAPTYKGYMNKVIEHLNAIRDSVKIIEKQLNKNESEV